MKEHTDNHLHDWQRYVSLGSGLALLGAGLRRAIRRAGRMVAVPTSLS